MSPSLSNHLQSFCLSFCASVLQRKSSLCVLPISDDMAWHYNVQSGMFLEVNIAVFFLLFLRRGMNIGQNASTTHCTDSAEILRRSHARSRWTTKRHFHPSRLRTRDYSKNHFSVKFLRRISTIMRCAHWSNEYTVQKNDVWF